MPQFVVERVLPGAGRLTAEELRAIAQKTNRALSRAGTEIVWQHSYVTDDRLFCLYAAPSPELIREHARQSGFPCDRVIEVRSTISPRTAHGPEPAAA